MVRIIQQFRQGFNGTGDQPQERGSVVVLVALALTTLLGLCAIVTDIGLMYAEKAHLQNSVDAAALAGVRELPSNPEEAKGIAIDYASKNGVISDDVHVIVDANNGSKIIVTASKQVPTHFARIWGITQELISVSANAVMVPPREVFGAIPLCIQEQVLVVGQSYELKSGGGSNESGFYFDDNENNKVKKKEEESGISGWYGAWKPTSDNENIYDYESDLADGYLGPLRVGQIVDVNPGVMSGPTERGITKRIGIDPVVYIPIVNIIENTKTLQIVGFAAFVLEGVSGNGNDSVVTGKYIPLFTPKLVAN